MITKTEATIEELYRVPDNGKAEIVDGELVLMSPAGGKHGRASGKIYASLNQHEELSRSGFAFTDNVGFIVDLPRRKSFSPDAAWYEGGPEDIDMYFVEGAPAFAVEVRSKDDYSPRAEQAILNKIRDYFAAGTKVVWDVDLVNLKVNVYRADSLAEPVTYGAGDVADAEPAVPGWRMPVEKIFA